MSISPCLRHLKPWHCAWVAVVIAAALPCSTPTLAAQQADTLTVERLFAAPDLSGDSLRQPQFSPDGRLVAYLKAAADDRDRLDLWAYDIRRGEHRLLIDARALAPQGEVLSEEEIARRERQRISSLSGILAYAFSPDSRHILVPLAGDIYLYDLDATPERAVKALTHTASYESDAQFSPRGRYVSFIRDHNLIVVEIATGRETAVTTQGGGTLSFGTAEFIAQEEMARDTGYWWSPDETRLAYTRVDESVIPEAERFEIQARSVRMVRQRYPFTGARNAEVSLFVTRLAEPARAVPVDLGPTPDIYLARVNFFPDSRHLAVQRQSRDQKTLDLLKVDAETGRGTPLLTEHSNTWVPLHDELNFLAGRGQFIWASSRSGFRHLYLYADDGRLLRQLTHGEHMIVGDRDLPAIRGMDLRRGWLYFTCPGDNPRERQLYRLPLDRNAEPQQLTRGAGWHSVTMSADAGVFLDTFSNTDTPPQLRLHRADGRLLTNLVPNTLGPDHPYFPYAAEHAPTEFGTLAAADSQRLHYALIKPRHMQPGRRYPVIVNVYGGPGVQNVTNAWGGGWQPFHQLLAREGYLIFMLDNRGSGQRGERFEAASYLNLGTVEVEDQLAGVRFLRTLPYVDGARIGVMGWSYGGYMVLMTLLKGPESFAAGVAGAPVTDWRLYDTHYTERFMSTPALNPQGYDNASVLTWAGQLQRPLLLIHGLADDNVLFTHSTALMKAFQEAGKPFDLMVYPGGMHGLIRGAEDGPHVMNQIRLFFQRTLQPPATTAPVP
ncbi:MAG: S9 family peptidase [Steroidobacteraceae bacterium]